MPLNCALRMVRFLLCVFYNNMFSIPLETLKKINRHKQRQLGRRDYLPRDFVEGVAKGVAFKMVPCRKVITLLYWNRILTPCRPPVYRLLVRGFPRIHPAINFRTFSSADRNSAPLGVTPPLTFTTPAFFFCPWECPLFSHEPSCAFTAHWPEFYFLVGRVVHSKPASQHHRGGPAKLDKVIEVICWKASENCWTIKTRKAFLMIIRETNPYRKWFEWPFSPLPWRCYKATTTLDARERN